MPAEIICLADITDQPNLYRDTNIRIGVIGRELVYQRTTKSVSSSANRVNLHLVTGADFIAYKGEISCLVNGELRYYIADE